ncbi:16532_t:CDS:2 [Entrophospora sp. SA101]|nr:16532_t:CDS:2 [Entrophospora sp. SA101]
MTYPLPKLHQNAVSKYVHNNWETLSYDMWCIDLIEEIMSAIYFENIHYS